MLDRDGLESSPASEERLVPSVAGGCCLGRLLNRLMTYNRLSSQSDRRGTHVETPRRKGRQGEFSIQVLLQISGTMPLRGLPRGLDLVELTPSSCGGKKRCSPAERAHPQEHTRTQFVPCARLVSRARPGNGPADLRLTGAALDRERTPSCSDSHAFAFCSIQRTASRWETKPGMCSRLPCGQTTRTYHPFADDKLRASKAGFESCPNMIRPRLQSRR
jgi:hypothetical protein